MARSSRHTSVGDSPGDGGAGSPIQSLVESFHSGKGAVREQSRKLLVEIGRSTVPALIDALSDPHWRVRWEAAKTLAEIPDRRAAPALVRTLEDSRPGVRWLASKALIAIGRAAVPPVLEALIDRPDSPWLRLGAHHVFRILSGRGMKQLLAPVLAALRAPDARTEVPLAAEQALITLTTRRGAPRKRMAA